MKKFKENNPIDIIEALCRMGNTEQVGKFEMDVYTKFTR